MASVVTYGGGETYGDVRIQQDRFLLDAAATGGRLSVVEHTVAPRVLAAPMHRHTREDEYSLVLEGRLGVQLDDEEVYADVGDFVVKPRGQRHTFWNAGDGTLRVCEIITPGGLEELFRELGRAGDGYDPESLPGDAARFGCTVDFEATAALAQRLDLSF